MCEYYGRVCKFKFCEFLGGDCFPNNFLKTLLFYKFTKFYLFQHTY